jgi:tRNA(Arg) A34 adenosine deaminase TadA
MYDISVRPAWRRKGLARALLTRALWNLRQRGEQVIRLNTVAEFRTRAQDLYRSVGFRLLKEFPRYRKSLYDIEHLRAAIALAWQAREHGNHPFGAVLVDEHNQVLLQAENTVVTGRDCTDHAETNLVRLATQRFSPEQLARCTLYSSTEPCAMCAGAIHWSQIGRVVYAISEVDLYAIIGPSPEHLLLPCRQVFAHSQRPINVVGPVAALDAEARAVHENFWTMQHQDGDDRDTR